MTKALLQGQAELAVPGVWVLTSFVPDCDMLNLPVFYGQPIDVVHRIIDGKPGLSVSEELEGKLKVKVLGPWLDLGFTNWFSTKKAAQHAGRSVRHEAAQLRRCRAGVAGVVLRCDS